jgi:hypothetical protein
MEWVILFASIVTAIATAVIAIYSWRSYQLSENMKMSSTEFQQRSEALFKAMATSTLLSSSGQPGSAEFSRRVQQFNRWNQDGLILDEPGA